MKIFILTLCTVLFLSCGQLQDKKISSNRVTLPANKMTDIERLIGTTLPFVEDLLKKYGEFFPLASAIQVNDSISQVATYDGDEKPQSSKVIADLIKVFREKKENYKTIAIFYDVKVLNPITNTKTDAVAIFIEPKNDSIAYTFYYPYSLSESRQLSLAEPWKDKANKEVFN